MTSFELFQCVPAYKPMAVNRVIRRAASLGCRMLLDLEDGIQDVINPERTPMLKQQAREDAALILETNPGIRFDLRINVPGSPDYEKDLEMVRACRYKPYSIFLPKIEKTGDLERILADFGASVRINPILESARGIRNMMDILTERLRTSVEFVFFGNYDYHLDTDFYPIREQNSWAYWALVQPLIRTIEELGMNFGNSPYAHICDTEGLRSIVHWLSSTCNKRFAVMSLQFNQTRTFYCLREENLSANINSLQDMDSDPGKILMEFEENRLKGRSFSLAGNTRRIITPQEYLLARKRKEDGKM